MFRCCGWRHAWLCLLDNLTHQRWFPYFRGICDAHERLIWRTVGEEYPG